MPRSVLSLSCIETSHLLQLNISGITLVKVDWATIRHCDPIQFVLKWWDKKASTGFSRVRQSDTKEIICLSYFLILRSEL